MRDFGTITGEGKGLQGVGMAYASANGSSLYKTNLKLTHMKKTKRIQRTHRPVSNFSIAKILLFPLLSVILVTIGCWFTKMSSLKCVISNLGIFSSINLENVPQTQNSLCLT